MQRVAFVAGNQLVMFHAGNRRAGSGVVVVAVVDVLQMLAAQALRAHCGQGAIVSKLAMVTSYRSALRAALF